MSLPSGVLPWNSIFGPGRKSKYNNKTLIRCYHSGPEWTWERWQWRGTPHSPKLQHCWNLTIRLFSVISRALVGGGLIPLQRSSRCILQPQPTGQGNGRIFIWPLSRLDLTQGHFIVELMHRMVMVVSKLLMPKISVKDTKMLDFYLLQHKTKYNIALSSSIHADSLFIHLDHLSFLADFIECI